MAGFTTVRDLGGDVAPHLRDAIAQGLVKGPRIYAAGKAIGTTGGHADPRNGMNAEISHALGAPGPTEGVINSVDDARQAVRQRYKEGSDLIKITATGGVLSFAKSGDAPQFTVEEIRAVVDTARDYGYTVAAHAHGKEGMRRAIEGGVTSIEHGTYMDEEIFELMKKHGTWYVPTISAGRFVAEKSKVPGYFPEIVRPKAAKIGAQIQDTFGKAWRAGVKIGFGTDQGVAPHGDNAREFGYMVETGYAGGDRAADRDLQRRAGARRDRHRPDRARLSRRRRRGARRSDRRHRAHEQGRFRDEGRRRLSSVNTGNQAMKKHTIARLLLGLLPAALAFAAASGASPTAESASVRERTATRAAGRRGAAARGRVAERVAPGRALLLAARRHAHESPEVLALPARRRTPTATR